MAILVETLAPHKSLTKRSRLWELEQLGWTSCSCWLKIDSQIKIRASFCFVGMPDFPQPGSDYLFAFASGGQFRQSDHF